MGKRKKSDKTFKSAKGKMKPARPPRIPLSDLARFPAENPNPVFRLNCDGRILYANDASQALLRDWACEVGGYAPKFWQDLTAKVLTRKVSRTIDIKHGKKIYAYFITPIADRRYVDIYASDITDRKLAEERLQISEQRLRDMMENVPAGISIATPERKVIATNPSLWKMFGFNSEEEFLDVRYRYPDRLFFRCKVPVS